MGEVINIADRKPKEETTERPDFDFSAIEARNTAKAKQINNERGSANKKVLRSYRIK